MPAMKPPRVEFARSLSTSLARARAMWVIAALLLGPWVWIAVAGGPDANPALYRLCGLSRSGVFAGRVWQVATYAFLHGSTFHLLLNLLLIIMVGGRVEHILGWRGFVRVSAAGILGGAAGHLLFAPGNAQAPILVGASGAAIALLLALTTLSPESRMWPLPVSGKNLGMGLLAACLLLALLHPALGVPGFAVLGTILADHGLASLFNYGHACHLGGGIGGWLAVAPWTWHRPLNRSDLLKQRQRNDARLAATRDARRNSDR
jgi:membrane associated rhomboid family serine protease